MQKHLNNEITAANFKLEAMFVVINMINENQDLSYQDIPPESKEVLVRYLAGLDPEKYWNDESYRVDALEETSGQYFDDLDEILSESKKMNVSPDRQLNKIKFEEQLQEQIDCEQNWLNLVEDMRNGNFDKSSHLDEFSQKYKPLLIDFHSKYLE